MSWVRKYIPERPEDIVGQEEAIRQLDLFVSDYKKQKKKAALIHGPPGAGKTSSVYAIAKKYDLEVVEVNASDFRNAKHINEKIGAAAGQMSLFMKSKIILVDEVDGLSGTKDRGGIPAIVKLIATSAFPIVCTANNPWDSKFKALRKAAMMIAFDPPTPSAALTVLSKICEAEGIQYDEAALKTLARKTDGDLRAAINDLQGLSHMVDKITIDSVKELDERNRVDTIENAVIKVCKNSEVSIAISAFDSIREDLDQVALWVDHNMPKEYKKPKDLARAYEHISRADVYKGRIRRRQHWRFLSHINAHLSAGIATAKDEKYPGMQTYEQTKRLLMIWMANMKYQKRKAIALKVAEKTHTSTKTAIQDTIPYLQFMFRNDELGNQLAESFDLEPEEVAWLKK